MNRLTVSFLFALFLISCSSEKDSKVTELQLKNFHGFHDVVLMSKDEFGLMDFDTLQVQSSDTSIQLPLLKSEDFYLEYDDENVHLYLEPGKLLSVDANSDKIVFDGELKAENQFYQIIHKDTNLTKHKWDYTLGSYKDFKHRIDNYFRAKDSLLLSMTDSQENKAFVEKVRLNDHFYHAYPLLDYIRSKVKDSEKKDSLQKTVISEDFLNIDKYKEYWNERYVFPLYNRYLTDYFLKEKYGNKKDSMIKERGYYPLKLEIAKEKYPPELLERILADDLHFLPDLSNPTGDGAYPSPKELINKYRSDMAPALYQKLIEKDSTVRAKSERYAVGKPMKEFNLLTDTKEDFILSVSKMGKPVLIDVWASWCGPCIGSFPKVNALQKKFKNEAEVISVSIDRDFESFEKGLEENDVPGSLHLYAEGNWASEFAKYFQIKAIPRYIAVDETGQFIDVSSPDEFAEYLEN